jgi:putative transposase
MVSLAARIITEFLVPTAQKRGMKPPVLAVGDGALGFWAAVRDVFPETRHQRDRVHKTSNVLDALPKSVHSRANPQLLTIPPRAVTELAGEDACAA